jgi:trimeric autotransporter adhesin
MKTRTHFLAIALTSIFLAIMEPNAPAVVPPPDGGYPGFTTAEGQNALKSLTTGSGNTGIGWVSLFSATTASFNTGVGAGTLALNTADENTATGAGALLLNTSGIGNTATGAFALLHNDTGNGNTATGLNALASNTSGGFNTAAGDAALQNNTTGSDNTAHGAGALEFNTGSENTAVGSGALLFNSAGAGNTATGFQALLNNTTGGGNVANGFQALLSNVDGGENTATGDRALEANTSGSDNTAIGHIALANNTTGSENTALGAGAGVGVTTADGVICIGAAGADVNDSCYIGNIFNQLSSGGTAIFVNANHKLGTMTSSQRFKQEIKPMEQASAVVYALEPVTFRYKRDIDPVGKSQFGLVAEDVEKVNPDLVVHDKEGKPYSVRYDQVNAMLLNEFLKEHRTVQEQGVTIAELKKEIANLTATMKEQAMQLQKVSAQVEAIRSVPQLLVDDR